MIVTGDGITEHVRVLKIANDEIQLDKEVSIVNNVTLTFQNMSIMTTLDHDVIKLNNTSFRIDDVTSVTGIADSLNRTQTIKKGFVQSDTFYMDMPMLTTAVDVYGNKPWDFSGYTPYVEDFSKWDMKNLIKTGTMKVDPNKPVEEIKKTGIITLEDNENSVKSKPQTTYETQTLSPIDKNADPGVVATLIW